nr:hypothetical protein [uncultured Mediterranean phage uvMED]
MVNWQQMELQKKFGKKSNKNFSPKKSIALLMLVILVILITSLVLSNAESQVVFNSSSYTSPGFLIGVYLYG